MVVAAGFVECAEVAKAFLGPELATAFEATLLLPACRLDGARADGPSSFGKLLIIHPTGVRFEIVLFTPNQLAGFSATFLDSSNLAQDLVFLTVPHLVAQWFNPLREHRF